ncbi:hypothetical protein A2217_00035 [Candidatus Peribacteria bacterium RIFOXYA2_FULL_55_28]|nr:MAG: hypothetical protein A2217_00035 [Candidatus Peribacteria bacterium RIFOXYA2_FULL_55_28]
MKLNGVTYTFPTSDGSASGKVLKTNSAGQLVWSTDQTGAGGGLSFAEASSYFVNDGGDTMTGGLLIHSTNDATKTVQAGVLLEISGVMSGRTLHAQDKITSSGTLVIKSGTLTGSGAATILAAERQTGAFLYASGTDVLALNSYQGTQSGANAHIAFGYRGYFDVQMYRSGQAGSGELVLRTQNKRTGMNAFRIVSQQGSANNNVFRVTTDGQVRADGSVSGGGADYAEWFYSRDKLVQGELVCVDITRENAVERCQSASDGNLMGVVSSPEQAAFIGNAFWGIDGITPPQYYLIGLLGQVAAKVTDENGPIRPGDSLTSANKPGLAMKAGAGDATVGVALEGHEKGEGQINVLISRRNSSLTVETVEEHVLKTVAAMEIEDEVQLLISDAVTKLNVDEDIEQEVMDQVSSIDLEGRIAAILALQTGSALPFDADTWTAALTFADGITVENELKATASVLIEKELSVRGAVTFSGALKVAAGIVTDTLTVSGSALILEDLEVAGAIRTESLEARGDIVAGGTLHAAAVEASGATLRGDTVIEGKLIINGEEYNPETMILATGGTVSMAEITVREALFVLGDITVEGLAKFLGNVEIQGNLTVSGSLVASGTLVVNDNQAGIAVIPETGTSVTVTFNPPFLVTPIVTASSDDFAPWRIRNQSSSGFTIELKDIAENEITFTWHAMGSRAPKTTLGEEGTHVRGIVKFPVDALGYPLSSSSVWNQCIRNQTPLDIDGQPFNCRRYHNEDLWTQPDLLVEFLWDYEADPKLVLPENYRIVIVDGDENGTDEPVDEDKDTGGNNDTGSDTGSGSTTDEDTGSGSTTGEDTGSGSTVDGGDDTGSGSTAGEDTGSGSMVDGGDDTGGTADTGTGSTAGDGTGDETPAADDNDATGDDGTTPDVPGTTQDQGTGNAVNDGNANGEDDAGGSIFDGLKGLFE